MLLSYFTRIILFVSILVGCKDQPTNEDLNDSCNRSLEVRYAKGFCLIEKDQYRFLRLIDPISGQTNQELVLVPKGIDPPVGISSEDIIQVPIETLVATSTTHIPALELIDKGQALIGFPNLDYISSEGTRARIDAGQISELGQNEALNIEVLLTLKPDLLMTFSIDKTQKGLEKVKDAGIPVLYNGDWTEEHPLGRAEWIKVFGALFDQKAKADSIFNQIEQDYINLRLLAQTATKTPTVISGALYKDVWYAPKGDSWAAQFLKDANSTYLWQDTKGVGSLQWNIEEILQYTNTAEVWIGPGQFTSYDQMRESSSTYTKFKPFKDQRIYTFSNTKGATGGLLYYELASMHPDWVLSDLIHILHPGLLPHDYKPKFFNPLRP
jgi:iron complex transport system substrate-binding protein